MSRYLAIDGGNSKTDVVVGDADGSILAFARGEGTCHQTVGLPEALSRLRALVDKARAEAGMAADQLFDRADVFLAGADLPSEIDMLTAALAAQAWTGTLRVDNDTFALLRAGTDAPDAVAVVCGAGTNCAGRRADGQTARFTSIGGYSGDWGGGNQLATLTLWHAVRGEDGRGPVTALSAAVADHCGLPTAEAVGLALHLGTLDAAVLSSLSGLLFTVAATGDPIAASLVTRQADEIAALAAIIASRLDLLASPVSVVLGGGVSRRQHAMLLPLVRPALEERVPLATVSVVHSPPVLGAALSALDALASPPAAHTRLRAALAADQA